MKKRFLFLSFLMLMLGAVNAQSPTGIVITTTIPDINVCEEHVVVTITIENTSVPSVAYTDVVVSSNMPDGVYLFADGANNGITGGTLVQGSNNNHPSFLLANNIPAGETATLTYKAKASCELISLIENLGPNEQIENETSVTFTAGGQSGIVANEPNNSATYDPKYAELELILNPADDEPLATNKEIKTRRLTVRNSGNGYVSGTTGVNIYMNYPSGLLHNGYTSPLQPGDITNVVNGTTTTSFTIINFQNVGDGDNLFEPGEEFLITESAKVDGQIGTLTTLFSGTYGCQSLVCNLNSAGSGESARITSVNGLPNFSITKLIPNEKINYCGQQFVELEFKNIGSPTTPYAEADRATNLQLSFSGLYLSSSIIDFTSFQIKQKDGSYASIASKGITATPSGLGSVVLSFSGIDPDGSAGPSGPHGIVDADGDEIYDDLRKGESVIIRAQVMATCPTALFSANTLHYGHYLYQAEAIRQDAFYSYVTNVVYSAYKYNFADYQKITGPVDIKENVTKPFTFEVKRTMGFSTEPIECPDNLFYSKLLIPPGYVIDGPVYWVPDPGTGLPSVLITPSAVDPVTHKITLSGGGPHGKYDINLKQVCETGVNYALTSEIEWEMFYVCESCSCEEKIVHQTHEMFNHCPSCDGYHTTDLIVERTTFGFPEPAPGSYHTGATLAALTPTTINAGTSGIRLDAAMPGDRIKLEAPGKLTLGTYTNAHVQVTYTSPISANLLQFVSGYFVVDGVTLNLPSGIQPTSLGGNVFSFDFEVPTTINTPGCSTCPSGFSAPVNNLPLPINLFATFEVLNGMDPGEYKLERFRAEHFGMNGSTREACESFGDNFSIVKIVFNHNNQYIGRSISSCNVNDRMLIGFGEEGYPGYDPFPNEFRPIVAMDKISSTIPANMQFTGVSFDGLSPAEIRVAHLVHSTSRINLGTPDVHTSSLVSWNRTPNWPVLDAMYVNDNFAAAILLVPICKHTYVDTDVHLTTEYDTYIYTGNPISEVGQRDNLLWSKKPSLSITGGTTLEGYSRTLTWNVRISNASGALTAENGWFTFIPPHGNIRITEVILPSGATVVPIPHTSNIQIVQVGAIPSGANNLLFQFKIEYSDCIEDFIDYSTLNFQASCNGYPADWDVVTCATPVLSQTLGIRYKTTDLRVELTEPAQAYPLCASIPYEIALINTGYADMNAIQLYIDVPPGVSLEPNTASYKYADASSYTLIPDAPAPHPSGDGRIGWNLSQSLIWNPSQTIFDLEPFVGTRETSYTDANIMNLKFNFVTSCPASEEDENGFDFGIPITFDVEGSTNCGELVTDQKEPKINLVGISLDKFDLEVIAGDFITCVPSVPITVKVTNIGDQVSSTDRLDVVLPPGIKFEFMTTGPEPTMVPAANLPPNPDGTRLLRWSVPPIQFTAPNNEFAVVFNASVIPNTATGTVSMSIKASMPAQTTCSTSGQTCNLRGSTAFDDFTREIRQDPSKPVIVVNEPCQTKPVLAGNSTTFRVTNFIPNATYRWDFQNDGLIDAVSIAPTVKYTYPEPGTYTAKVTVSIGTCAEAWETIEVEVVSVSLSSAEIKFCPCQSEGEPVTLTASPSNLPANDYVWFKNGVLVPNIGPTIVVDMAASYTVVIKSYSCVPDPAMLTHLDPVPEGYYRAKANGVVVVSGECPPCCDDCVKEFYPEPNKKYVLSIWVKEDVATFTENYSRAGVKLLFPVRNGIGGATVDESLPVITTTAGSPIIEGWQRIEHVFTTPQNTFGCIIRLQGSPEVGIYYDDLRIHPYEGNMKTFVYDPESLRLMSVLDENNYATFYEYDAEGKLIRIKKETERGIMTIQESLNNIYKKDEQ